MTLRPARDQPLTLRRANQCLADFRQATERLATPGRPQKQPCLHAECSPKLALRGKEDSSNPVAWLRRGAYQNLRRVDELKSFVFTDSS